MPHLRLSSGETRFAFSGAARGHVPVHVVAPGPARDGVPVEDVHLEGHGSLSCRGDGAFAATARLCMWFQLFFALLLWRTAVSALANVRARCGYTIDAPTAA